MQRGQWGQQRGAAARRSLPIQPPPHVMPSPRLDSPADRRQHQRGQQRGAAAGLSRPCCGHLHGDVLARAVRCGYY